MRFAWFCLSWTFLTACTPEAVPPPDADTDASVSLDAPREARDTGADLDGPVERTDTGMGSDAPSMIDASVDARVSVDSGASGCHGFSATPRAWMLPTGLRGGLFHNTSDDAIADGQNWFMTDLDGDGADDIVFTRSSLPGVGSSVWHLYRNDRAGAFGPDPAAWDLPDELGYQLQYWFPTGTGDPRDVWSLDRVDDDLSPDVLYTSSALDPSVGVDSWWVYRANGTGFDESPTAWALPRVSRPTPLRARDGTDIDGDGFLDIVLTRSISDPEVGVSRWDVYLGRSSGFGAVTSWTLPPGYNLTSFSDLDLTDAETFILQDLDGDGARDLVVTRSTADPTIGVSHWLVYPNTGRGYLTTGSPYAIPEEHGPMDYPNGYLDDWTGDGVSDLMVISDLTDTLGRDHWILHRGSPTGLGPGERVALPWTLPIVGFSWSLFEADGDGVWDLVVTRDPSDPLVGEAYWNVYPGCFSP